MIDYFKRKMKEKEEKKILRQKEQEEFEILEKMVFGGILKEINGSSNKKLDCAFNLTNIFSIYDQLKPSVQKLFPGEQLEEQNYKDVWKDGEESRQYRNNLRQLGVNLQKTEFIRFVYEDQVTCYENKNRRKFHSVGSRMGSFHFRHGFSETINSMEKWAVGRLCITTRHLYFFGDRSFRVRLDKIAGIVAYNDGFTITRDIISAKQHIFKMDKNNYGKLLVDIIAEIQQ